MKHPLEPKNDHYRSVTEIIKEIKKISISKQSVFEEPEEESGKGVMSQIKKVVKKFRKNEKYK